MSRDVEAVVETDPELEQLYRERERLQFVEVKTAACARAVREHRERVESCIARLEAGREC